MNESKVNFVDVEELYVLKAFDSDGQVYGYYAPHPEEEGLPYYDDDVNNAITFEDACEAESKIESLENGSELQFVIEKVKKVKVKLDNETIEM